MTTETFPNRRPIANIFRKTASATVRWCVAKGIDPNWISWSSVIAAATASVCFAFWRHYPPLLLFGATGCLVRLWFNMLDGMVAIAASKSSKQGEIANELPDRISDVIIFVGLAHSHPSCLIVGYWAAIGALFTAYMGTLSQAVSAPRQFGGLMSKPWRMVVVIAAAALLFVAPTLEANLNARWGLSPFAIACGIVVVGCIQTTIIRYRKAIAWLTANGVAQPMIENNGQ